MINSNFNGVFCTWKIFLNFLQFGHPKMKFLPIPLQETRLPLELPAHFDRLVRFSAYKAFNSGSSNSS